MFGFINSKKNKLLNKIGGAQKRLENYYSAGLVKLEANLINEFESVLLQEEILWQQKSRNNWIHLGDKNASFFHNKTQMRHNRNIIDMLQVDGNNWCYEQEILKTEVANFFNDLFTKEEGVIPKYDYVGAFPTLTEQDKINLGCLVSKEESKDALFDMGLLTLG